MVKKSIIQSAIEKKQIRREEELEILRDFEIKLHSPVPTKKPAEFKFDKDDVNSFEYPVAIGNTTLEKKSDGFCVHLSIDHKSHEKIKMYSSMSNEWDPRCFPELLPDLLKCPSGYYHAEVLGLKPDGVEKFKALDEFIAIEERSKKTVRTLTQEILEKYPLKLDIFDVLIMEDKKLLSKPLQERRELLEKMINETKHVNLTPQWEVVDKKQLQSLYLWAVDNNYEGLIAKDPESFYVPGSRNTDWIKLKEFITFDLAVLGIYETEKSIQAGKLFSSVLVGSYNQETKMFETLAKIIVPRKEDREEIQQKVGSKIVEEAHNIMFNPSMFKVKRKIPNKLVRYDSKDITILEIEVLDVRYGNNVYSCGLGYDGQNSHSLRISTFQQIRKDKTRMQDVTTTQQIHDFYLGLC